MMLLLGNVRRTSARSSAWVEVVQRMQGVGLALTLLVASAAPSQAYRAVISQELTVSPPSFLSLVPDSLLSALGDQLFNELSVGDGFRHTVSKTDTGVRVDVHVYDPTVAGELEVAMAAFGAEQATPDCNACEARAAQLCTVAEHHGCY